MAYIVMACVVMAYIAMTYVVMAYMVMVPCLLHVRCRGDNPHLYRIIVGRVYANPHPSMGHGSAYPATARSLWILDRGRGTGVWTVIIRPAIVISILLLDPLL